MAVMGVEPEIVLVAQRVRQAQVRVREAVEAFGRAFLYTRTSPEAPQLHVADLGSSGRWASVFSTTDRLATSAGECDALGMSGLDFVEFTPAGVGLVLDPHEPHALPLPAEMIDRSAVTLGVRRAA